MLATLSEKQIYDTSFVSLALGRCLFRHTVDTYVDLLVTSQYESNKIFRAIPSALISLEPSSSTIASSVCSSLGSHQHVINQINLHPVVFWVLNLPNHWVLAVIYKSEQAVAILDSCKHDQNFLRLSEVTIVLLLPVSSSTLKITRDFFAQY